MLELFSPFQKNYCNWAPLFLRLAIGSGFLAHGWAKLSRGPAGLEKLLHVLHIPFASLMAYVLPYIELIGGLAVLLGLFVSIVSVPLIITMLVAMFTIHIKYGFSSVNTIGLTPEGPKFGPPGYEINLVYIAGLISLIVLGAGVFSMDALLASRKKGQKVLHQSPAANKRASTTIDSR
jgi:putative oxidoreductase